MFGLMFSCGISTFIMGALTGGFFGDFLPQLAGIINPNTTFKALPSLFTPLDDTRSRSSSAPWRSALSRS